MKTSAINWTIITFNLLRFVELLLEPHPLRVLCAPGLVLLLELGQLLLEAGDLVLVHPLPGLQLPTPHPLELEPNRHVVALPLQLHDLPADRHLQLALPSGVPRCHCGL